MTQYEKILTYTLDEMAKYACRKVCLSCENSGYCDKHMKKICIDVERKQLLKEVK